MNNINVREIAKIGLVLFAITAISALLLAFVNKATAPVIEKNRLTKTYDAMASVMSGADTFNPVETNGADGILEAYEALDSSGKSIGKCVISTANGYGGEIQVLVGIDAENTVTGIEILSHSETPGLGANSEKPEFKNQFTGKSGGIGVSKGNAKENEINAMSGATITSKAVTAAVNNALEFAGGNL